MCLLGGAVRSSIVGLGLYCAHLSRLPSSPLVAQDVRVSGLARRNEGVNILYRRTDAL